MTYRPTLVSLPNWVLILSIEYEINPRVRVLEIAAYTSRCNSSHIKSPSDKHSLWLNPDKHKPFQWKTQYFFFLLVHSNVTFVFFLTDTLVHIPTSVWVSRFNIFSQYTPKLQHSLAVLSPHTHSLTWAGLPDSPVTPADSLFQLLFLPTAKRHL